MVPRSFVSTFAACLLFTSSMAAPAPAPEAKAQPAAEAAPVHGAEHRAARYAKSFIYERRQVPTHPTSTLKERDAGPVADEVIQLEKRGFTHHGPYPHGPHPNFWHHGPRWGTQHPSSPQPSSGFSLPPIPVKERRDAPYSYLNKRDANAFAYPDHGYEGFYKAKRDAMWGGGGHVSPFHHGPPPSWGHGPALPVPSSGFHLPQWGQHSPHSPYQFGREQGEFPHKTGPHAAKNTNEPQLKPRAVKAPTNVKRDEGMPRYAMGY